MKVNITKETRRWITLEEASAARTMIKDLAENDDYSVRDYAKSAAELVNSAYIGCAGNIRIYEASAEITRNQRVWDKYCEGSGHLDVWITLTAQLSLNEIAEIGAYLSDIWEATGYNSAELVDRMYIKRYRAE